MTTFIEDLKRTLEGRLSEIEDETTRFRIALDALDDVPTAMEAEAPRPERIAPERAEPEKPKAVLPAGKLKTMLKKKPGSTSNALATEANADPKQILTLLKEMEQTGEARREGRARGTRWFLV